jgi:Uma2 family endonuclease
MGAMPAFNARYTPEEYLAFEREAEQKSEYLDGVIYAMSGGSPEHSSIALNIGAELRTQLRAKPCRAYTSDMKVRTDLGGMFSYPDLSVACGDPRFHDERRDVLVNPIVIFEVLSDTTEAYDRGRKFARYQQIVSLREYVLVAQDEPRVEVYSRHGEGQWLLTVAAGLESSIRIPSIGCELALTEVYEKVEFAAAEPPGPAGVRPEGSHDHTEAAAGNVAPSDATPLRRGSGSARRRRPRL